jgi:hypothetical protein
MGWACGTIGGGTVVREHNMVQGKKLEAGLEDVGWTNVAQDRDGSRAVMGAYEGCIWR